MKVLNITIADQNRNMNIFYKKNSEVELHSSNTFFCWPTLHFAIVSWKIHVTFESSQDILHLET